MVNHLNLKLLMFGGKLQVLKLISKVQDFFKFLKLLPMIILDQDVHRRGLIIIFRGCLLSSTIYLLFVHRLHFRNSVLKLYS